MRLFQNFGLYPTYRRHFDRRHGTRQDFKLRRQTFLIDRYGASHLLLPVLASEPEAFYTNGDDEILQQAWARENGLPRKTVMSEILLAQIEAHRSEVFYNLDPMRYGSDFLRRLPGCVRHTLAWRAAPSQGADLGGYGRMLCNFPTILDSYRERGWRAAYLAPAHDPVMDKYAIRQERPIDVLFVGGYTRYHKRRAEVLEAVAALAPMRTVKFHLDRSRLTRLAETPLGWVPAVRRHRRPTPIRHVSAEPVFGLDLYEALSQAKVVLNGAIDMAGEDRGNMRCFESMGCGALMISDAGRYPQGMEPGSNMLTYVDATDVGSVIRRALDNENSMRQLAWKGYSMISSKYNKAKQWRDFQSIVAAM